MFGKNRNASGKSDIESLYDIENSGHSDDNQDRVSHKSNSDSEALETPQRSEAGQQESITPQRRTKEQALSKSQSQSPVQGPRTYDEFTEELFAIPESMKSPVFFPRQYDIATIPYYSVDEMIADSCEEINTPKESFDPVSDWPLKLDSMERVETHEVGSDVELVDLNESYVGIAEIETAHMVEYIGKGKGQEILFERSTNENS